MATSTQWQLAASAAGRYEEVLVPSILGPAAQALVAWAVLKPGEHFADIGCGTGAATRFAAKAVGRTGRAIGIDINPGMLAVAKSALAGEAAATQWIEAGADSLPLPDQSLDAVLCAQTLQFLKDRPAALGEMRRVLKPGGRAMVSLWCGLADNPYFDALVAAIAKRIDPETAMGLGAAFQLSNAEEIHTLFLNAGFPSVEMTVAQCDLDLPRVAEFVPRHVGATPMAAGFNAASQNVRDLIVEDVASRLASYRTESGIRVPFRTNLVKAKR